MPTQCQGLLSIYRPVYQYQYESLRCFDHWLKGIDNGIMEEPPVRLFVMGANMWKTTMDDEILWFVSLWDVDENGGERFLTRGWLRGSQRAVDSDSSTPWERFHPHTKREPLKPGDVCEFNIKIVQTANIFKQGHRIKLKISGVDDETPKNFLEGHAQGHVRRQTPSWITIYHDADHPSCLLLPITDGNIIGTYMSGGNLYFGA